MIRHDEAFIRYQSSIRKLIFDQVCNEGVAIDLLAVHNEYGVNAACKKIVEMYEDETGSLSENLYLAARLYLALDEMDFDFKISSFQNGREFGLVVTQYEAPENMFMVREGIVSEAFAISFHRCSDTEIFMMHSPANAQESYGPYKTLGGYFDSVDKAIEALIKMVCEDADRVTKLFKDRQK